MAEVKLELRRTGGAHGGAHGLLEKAAVDAAGFIVEEEASFAGREPNASGRQTSDSDTAAVRLCRRGRRFVAFCWS
jgi:hypothetical protein